MQGASIGRWEGRKREGAAWANERGEVEVPEVEWIGEKEEVPGGIHMGEGSVGSLEETSLLLQLS